MSDDALRRLLYDLHEHDGFCLWSTLTEAQQYLVDEAVTRGFVQRSRPCVDGVTGQETGERLVHLLEAGRAWAEQEAEKQPVPAKGMTYDEQAVAVFLASVKRGSPLTKVAIAAKIRCCRGQLQPKRAPLLADAIRQYKAKPLRTRSVRRIEDE